MLTHPRGLSLLALLAAVGALGTALASEYWGGLLPCVLCIYQRWAYVAAGAFGLLGLALAGRPAAWRATMALTAGAYLGGAAIAGFHVGVERKWWRGTDACHGPEIDPGASLDEMKALLLDQSFVACDEIPWALFGISMAGYNLIAMLALGLFFAWAVGRGQRAMQ